MKLRLVHAVYFSATGNTKRVVTEIAQGLAKALALPFAEDDFTPARAHTDARRYAEDELLVFGTPTFAGRVPNKVLPFVQTLFHGSRTPAVALVTYGNRAFENSLIELRNELRANGFLPLAAAAVACAHSFAHIGAGRPDKEDAAKMAEFVRRVAEKLAGDAADTPPVDVPGDSRAGYYTPLGTDGKPVNFLKAKPRTRPEACDGCGLCVTRCPMGSILAENPHEVPGICIKCQACVHHCPKQAKYFDDPAMQSHIAFLETHYQRRSASEFFV